MMVRRATLEDIGPLTALWRLMHFDADALAKRITEFQVAQSPKGEIIGAVGLQIAEKQGCIHSEGFTDFADAESLRPVLWERINSLAANHGLVRLWTREQAPFWSHCGLHKAEPESLQRLPLLWRGEQSGWLTLKLRDDIDTIISVDKEFSLFMQAERQRTQKRLRQAQIIKYVAALVAFGILLAVLIGAFYLMSRHRLPAPR
jgi:N-acetylglutamate synthase-like GNAT family acetyltransferase